MRADYHISVARSDVRGGELARHVARRYESGRVYLVCSGLGWPRTWGLATRAVISGFERALSATENVEPAERLKQAFSEGRTALADLCDTLVERTLPDATLVAFTLVDGQLHVMGAGTGRVYLQRSGKPKRLTSREESKEGGLLRARPSVCSTAMEPGDLVLAGSVSAFSVSSIAKAVTVLTEDAQTAPGVLASLLTEPAAKAGVGAAAIVLRVR